MRTSILYSAAGLLFLMTSGMECCGVGGPEVVPLTSDDECAWFGCDLAIDGEVLAEVWTGGALDVTAVTIDPTDLADVSIDGTRVTLRPHRAGTGTFTVTFSDGTSIVNGIGTGALATTTVVPLRSTEGFGRVYPPGRKQMFIGSTLRVAAQHRSADGRSLLGHGFETWTATGGNLHEPVADGYIDTARMRDVVATGAPVVSISARGGGTPFEIEVVPPGSTTVLELAYKTGNVRYGELALRSGEYVRVPVSAFTADGRFIHGRPPGVSLTAKLADKSLATITASDSDRSLRFTGLAPGRSDLDVTFDGLTRRFTLVVY